MAEQMTTDKKKRGRPPKQKQETQINENKSSVKMVNEVQPVSIGDVNNKLKSIFIRMQNNHIPYQTFTDAINRSPLNISSFLNNPFIQSQRISKSNPKSNLSSKKEIGEALKNPENNENLLRQSSMALFYNNYVYQNLIKLNRDIPQYFYYAVPVGVNKKDLVTDKFKKQKRFINKFLQKFDVSLTFKNISLQIAREGKCSYVFRESHDTNKGIVDFALLQKLPPDYVKYTGFGSESPLIVSFNFMINICCYK